MITWKALGFYFCSSCFNYHHPIWSKRCPVFLLCVTLCCPTNLCSFAVFLSRWWPWIRSARMLRPRKAYLSLSLVSAVLKRRVFFFIYGYQEVRQASTCYKLVSMHSVYDGKLLIVLSLWESSCIRCKALWKLSSYISALLHSLSDWKFTFELQTIPDKLNFGKSEEKKVTLRITISPETFV